MKNYVVLFLFINFSVFSQNRNEINKIIGTYNTSELNNIKTSIIESNNQKQSRVNNYLLLNASKQESFVVNGVMYKMIDVIDNKPLYISTDNRNSALAVKTNNLYPGGNLGLNLTGAGMNIGVWDGGWALTTHEEFLNAGVSRITTPDTQTINPAAEFHATHVVGTIGASGININARGMAYESNIKSYNWTSDNTEVISEAANYGLLISNHSYGIPINSDDGSQSAPDWMMGNYNTDASQWDQISFNAPYYLEVTSAGNSGMDTYSNGLAPGLDKLTGEKNAKNNLVVANANPTVNPITGAITNLVINGSSSQGPSDDGRIKPDITADGTNVLSTIETSTTSYGTATGTSMSSPSVAGSLLLLQQHYNNLNSSFMRAATLKGLVCHTALDDNANVGPDPYFGWGMLNTSEAATLITQDTNSTAIIDERVLNIGGTYSVEVVVSTAQTLKATICWTDPAGSSKNGQLNATSPALKHDLDLRIIKNTEVNFPWKLQLSDLSAPAIKGDNIVDNVEKVEVDNAIGTYTIQVSHKGFLVGGSQAYSLVISGYDGTLDNQAFNPDNITVFPNPTADKVFINSGKKAIISYQIYDLQGRLINSIKLNKVNNLEVDLSNYNSGIYLINLKTESSSSSYKIVKK